VNWASLGQRMESSADEKVAPPCSGQKSIFTPTCTFFSQREEKIKKGSSINYPSLMRA